MHGSAKEESAGSGTRDSSLFSLTIIIIIICMNRIHRFYALATILLPGQAVWTLKMRALTLQVYVDDIEGEEEGIAETMLDNYAISTMPRPGTSLRNPGTSHTGQGVRPKSQSGSLRFI